MTDFPSTRLEAAAWRVSAIVRRNFFRKFAHLKITDATEAELEVIRRRALYPYALVQIAKRLWSRGHTIDGTTEDDYRVGARRFEASVPLN